MRLVPKKVRRIANSWMGGPFVPTGHYHSPFPDLQEIRRRESTLFQPPAEFPAIQFDAAAQMERLKACLPFYVEQPWSSNARPDRRFRLANEFFSYSDALFLYFTLRLNRPARYVEVGSGYSSHAVLDVRDLFLDDYDMDVTFIEPYPDRLLQSLRPEDHARMSLVQSKLQDVPLEVFKSLAANDILFIDSSHVVKTDSDVNRIVFEILPALASGVLVHIHDIFDFSYPAEWVYEGRAWQEAYLVRAFLQFNEAFEIYWFDSYLQSCYRSWFAEQMPLCLEAAAQSIWLRRV
jgi:hypothetical protein